MTNSHSDVKRDTKKIIYTYVWLATYEFWDLFTKCVTQQNIVLFKTLKRPVDWQFLELKENIYLLVTILYETQVIAKE